MIVSSDWPISKSVAPHDGNLQAEFHHCRIVIRADAFDGGHAEGFADLGEFDCFHGLEAPAHDALLNAPFRHGAIRKWLFFGFFLRAQQGCEGQARECSGTRSEEAST